MSNGPVGRCLSHGSVVLCFYNSLSPGGGHRLLRDKHSKQAISIRMVITYCSYCFDDIESMSHPETLVQNRNHILVYIKPIP